MSPPSPPPFFFLSFSLSSFFPCPPEGFGETNLHQFGIRKIPRVSPLKLQLYLFLKKTKLLGLFFSILVYFDIFFPPWCSSTSPSPLQVTTSLTCFLEGRGRGRKCRCWLGTLEVGRRVSMDGRMDCILQVSTQRSHTWLSFHIKHYNLVCLHYLAPFVLLRCPFLYLVFCPCVCCHLCVYC